MTDIERFDPEQSAYPVLFGGEDGGIAEILADNFGDEGFRTSDLDRIKIPAAGGRFWDIPDEAPQASIEGVVVHKQKTRSYWVLSADEKGDGDSGAPPDCASADGILGNGLFGPGSEGNRTGECAECPMNSFGSAAKGEGKACKEQEQVFMLQEGSILPIQVTLPPTSLKPWRKFLTRLTSKGYPYYGVVTKLGLVQDRSQSGQTYSLIAPERGAVLSAEERAAAKAYGQTIAASFHAAQDARTDAAERQAGDGVIEGRARDAEGNPLD